MIEVMVAIFVVSIGLMGVAGLQMNAMKYMKTASQRSEATQAAYDISERMRANGSGVLAGNYVYTTAYSTIVASLPTVTACSGLLCSNSEVADIDIAEWQRNLAFRLNGGAGNIVQIAAGRYDVVVMWKEPNYTATDPACAATTSNPGAGVRCFVVRFSP